MKFAASWKKLASSFFFKDILSHTLAMHPLAENANKFYQLL
jgi:hypothetical protein